MLTLEDAKKEAIRYIMLSIQRRATGPYDFGDINTIGLHVKKKGYDEAGADERVFGRFLGKLSDGKYYIGTTNALEWVPAALEAFDTEQEMKELWRLD